MWDVSTLFTYCFRFVVFRGVQQASGMHLRCPAFFALEARGRVLWVNPLRRRLFIKRLNPSPLSCNNIRVVLYVIIINMVVFLHEGFVQI
jgi:hypothetical protein